MLWKKDLILMKKNREKFPITSLLLNGGLCLFNPWFPRLFVMLDYLDKDKKAFKVTASQIRAVFLAAIPDLSWRRHIEEMELVFNRLLVNLPMHIPHRNS